jgi:polysaccharide pyruvyl transferase WcaK-like protein
MSIDKILYMDCWSDHNRGDAAMQIGLIQLVRRFAPQAKLTVMGAYGHNQYPEFVSQMDETSSIADETVGGFRSTFVPFHSDSQFANASFRRIRTLASLIMLPFMVAYLTAARVIPPLLLVAPKSLRLSVKAVRDADVILWNGRNFRSDSALREPYEISQLLFNPLIARIYRTPTAAIGVSIWPLKSRLSRFLLARSLNRCFFVSARESNSYSQAVEALGVDAAKVHLLPDLSLAAILSAGPVPDRSFTHDRPARFAITVVDWTNNGMAARTQYVEALIGFVRARLAEDPGVTFTLVPQVTYEMESTGSLFRQLTEVDPLRVLIARDVPTVHSLVSEYAEYDFLIATRMHSAIFATCSFTPVVTIPYDVGGKWAILDMMGQADISVPFREVTADALTALVDAVWDQRVATAARIRKNLPDLADRVSDNVRVPLELIR